MTSLLPHLLVLTCECCRAFEPFAPYTTRAIESGWGEPLHGVSLLVTTDSDTVRVGDAMRFEIFLRFNPFDADGRVKFLDEAEEHVSLHLASLDGPRDYVRAPYRVGMPAFPPPDPVALVYGDVGSRAERFYLLSDDGEQVPPGDYLVHVSYRNEGWERRGKRARRMGEPDSDPLGSGVRWSGTVDSGSFALHVEAGNADTSHWELPTRISITSDSAGLPTFLWDETSFEPVVVVSRPGYHVSCGTTITEYIDDEPVESRPRRSGGLPKRGGVAARFSGPKFREALSEGRQLRVELEVAVFETSEPPQHMWMPERGDYRVLKINKIASAWP